MTQLNSESVVVKAIEQLNQEVIDGMRHGFFEVSVTCEMVNGKKRRLIINAGKKHCFTIPAEELEQAG